MAITINGATSWGIVPYDDDTSNLATMSYDYRNNFLKSANDPLRYQIQWFSTVGGAVTEGTEPNKLNWTGGSSLTNGAGDLVNVIFKVYTTTDNSTTYPTNWDLIGTIKKSRDIANKKYLGGGVPVGHRFTIDVSQLVADQLSYSLVPIDKGTWQGSAWGGMNGGLTMQDNVIGGTAAAGSAISQYNVSPNGTFRKLRITTTYEVINGAGDLVTPTETSISNEISVINSVNQFGNDDVYYYVIYNIGLSGSKGNFLTRCPNSDAYDFKKPVRLDEQAEWLQFYIQRTTLYEIGGSGDDLVGALGLKIETYLSNGTLENEFYLRDFEDNMSTLTNSGDYKFPEDYQNSTFVQNVSPDYIINGGNVWSSTSSRATYPYWTAYTGDTITASTAYYKVSLSKFGMWSPYTEKNATYSSYYVIDREDENIPYGYVRFHWLNRMGGIDSYTAKRNVMEGLTINREVIERKSGDRTWGQADSYYDTGTTSEENVDTSAYISDTMRGGDIYKGGREVTNVSADRVQSVYTEPLNKSTAEWLEEIMTSPNVWIEMDKKGTQRNNTQNPYLRPSTKGYIPVIITNSDIETVSQENSLVKFNIEYTLAHKVVTQRN